MIVEETKPESATQTQELKVKDDSQLLEQRVNELEVRSPPFLSISFNPMTLNQGFLSFTLKLFHRNHWKNQKCHSKKQTIKLQLIQN
jgi:hypothetical protein